ncbi:MAG TPA: glycosyltransferase [Longimicrobiales bacterium]|nr:glycosyltransferase [Longimicrobiales bacterium]
MSEATETPAHPPLLSAILVAPDGPAEVRKTLRHVQAQDVRDRIEVILVTEEPDRFEELDDEFAELGGLRRVPFQPIERMGPAKAAGIAVARGGLVVHLEDHAYPRAGWARALLDAWREGEWAAVGPAMGNANPRSGTSWANLFVGYGRWVAPSWSGEREALPGHNCAFDKRILMERGDELGADFDDEWAFFGRLRERGHRFYLTAEARVDHQNISAFASAARLRFHHGRLTAADRARSWSLGKRAAHVLALPLVPLRRFQEVWHQVRASGIDGSIRRRLLPSLLALVTVGSLGEGVGYAFGPGSSPRRKADLEHDRTRHLNRRDREEAERERLETAAGRA